MDYRKGIRKIVRIKDYKISKKANIYFNEIIQKFVRYILSDMMENKIKCYTIQTHIRTKLPSDIAKFIVGIASKVITEKPKLIFKRSTIKQELTEILNINGENLENIMVKKLPRYVSGMIEAFVNYIINELIGANLINENEKTIKRKTIVQIMKQHKLLKKLKKILS
jgi:hypothetical protein